MQVLKQCKGLRSLYLYFESDLISDVPSDKYEADLGIRELCSVRGIKRVEIFDLEHNPLRHCSLSKWLKEIMESPKKE